MNGSHIAIPTILKVGKGTLKDIGSYIKDSRIENAVVYFGNGLVDMFGDTVLQSFQKENINVLEYKELDAFPYFFPRSVMVPSFSLMEILFKLPLKFLRTASMYSFLRAACSFFSSSVSPTDWDLW